MLLQDMSVHVYLTGSCEAARPTGEKGLGMGKEVLLQLVFSIEALAAEGTVERTLVNHTVLY